MTTIPDYTPKSNEAEWHITYRCDLACPNCNRLCFLPPTTSDMTLDDAREFTAQRSTRSSTVSRFLTFILGRRSSATPIR